MLDKMVRKNIFLSLLVSSEWVSEHALCLIIDALLYMSIIIIIDLYPDKSN